MRQVTKVLGLRLIIDDRLPRGFVAVQSPEPWPDTHTMLLTPSGKVLDLGRPRDLFPARTVMALVDDGDRVADYERRWRNEYLGSFPIPERPR